MTDQHNRQWVGEARYGGRRTLVTFQLPDGSERRDVVMDGGIPRINGTLRPEIRVRPALGKSRGCYERPRNVVDNTKEA